MNIRRAIRIICILLEIICFMPTILVSCSDETVKLTALNGVTGYEDYSGHILCLLMLCVPIFAFIVMLAAEDEDKFHFGGVGVAVILDMFVWNMFKKGVEEYVQEEGYRIQCVETTNWYTFNYVLLVIVLALCIIKIAGIRLPRNGPIQININTGNLNSVVNTENAGRKINNVKETMMAVSGAAVVAAKEQKEKHAKEEMERRLEQERIAQLKSSQNDEGNAEVCFCTQCGKQIHTAMNFCKYCGTKLK